MQLLQQFREYIAAHQLWTPHDGLLLAVSGGVDSVVLCELCKQAGYSFAIAHCNFQLRGQESERDETFVRSLGERYGVEVLVKRFDTAEYAAANKLSIQEAARELRYEWFREEVRSTKSEVRNTKKGTRHKAQESPSFDSAQDGSERPSTPLRIAPLYIVTAHHADDNMETMLMHFFRGTGIHGLRGMLPKQDTLVRPLLFARKEDLLQFAQQHSLPWVEDSSNTTDKYARNYFRHQVIPLLQQVFPAVESNLLDNLQRFADMEVLYEQALHKHLKKLLITKGDEVHIPVLKLKHIVPLQTVVYEVIRQFGFSAAQTGEVVSLLNSESGKYVQSATHRIIRNRNWLIVAPLQSSEPATILIEDGDAEVSFPNGKLVLKTLQRNAVTLSADNAIALLDAKDIRFPLLLRKWKHGDYFYPLGLGKKKKVARFLIDQKLSMTDKEKVWVLEMNKTIIWIVGLRIDDRFKVGEGSKKVLRVEYS